MRIGVLAIQGDYGKHREMLAVLGQEAPLVRTERELAGCDGLIVPGGESTTLTIILHKHGLWIPWSNSAAQAHPGSLPPV